MFTFCHVKQKPINITYYYVPTINMLQLLYRKILSHIHITFTYIFFSLSGIAFFVKKTNICAEGGKT